jgi:hypothetical protein
VNDPDDGVVEAPVVADPNPLTGTALFAPVT